MRGPRRFLSTAVALLTFATMLGCAGKVPQNGPGALNIAQFNLQDGAVNITYRQLLVASGGLQPYTWTIASGNLPPGLSVSTDGIISGTPSSDPSQYPTPYCQPVGTPGQFPINCSFTILVTDSQSPTKAVDMASRSITVNPDLTFTSNPLASGTVNLPYSVSGIQATYGVGPYIYTVATCDTCGKLPDGLSLATLPPMPGMPNPAMVFGTPTAAGVFTFTVQATDSALTPETATATFTITIVGRLNGPYVLSLSGFDTSQPAGSQAFYMVGSLTASGDMNGMGTISGLIDQNGPGAGNIATAVPVTGTYNIPANTNFGTMTFTRMDNNAMYNFQVLVSSNTDSRVMLVDPNNQKWGSGVLKVQSATTITITSSSAVYAFGLFGNNASGGRYAGAGGFALSPLPQSFNVLGGAEDTNDAGTMSGELSITSGSLSVPDSTGRGTATLVAGGQTFNYIYYIASATELVAMANDASGPATLVDILQQGSAGISGGGPTLCKTGDVCQGVLELNGLSSSGTPEAEVGVVSFGPPDQNGHNIIRTDGLPAYYTDQNVGGTVGSNSYTTGTFSVDASCGPLASPCGRVTVNLDGATYQPVWYVASQSQAFVVGTDPNVTQGTIQPQAGTGFALASLLGSYLGGTLTPVSANITNDLEVIGTPPPGGIWDVTFNTSGPTGQLNGVVLDLPYILDPTYGTAFGKFELTNSTQPPQNLQILYLVGGTVGATGGKGGVVGLNVGVLNSDGTVSPDPNPRLTFDSR